MFLIEYIKKYRLTYISVILLFLIGVILGIFISFKVPEKDRNNINRYLNDTIETIKEKNIDRQCLFKEKLSTNLKDIGIVWLLGCTIIAGFTIYIFMIYKGILCGYIITIIILLSKKLNGFKLLIIAVITNNLVYMPIIFLLSTSGIRLYKEIIKRKINIKHELLRHTIIMGISVIFMLITSWIDAYILTSLLYFL